MSGTGCRQGRPRRWTRPASQRGDRTRRSNGGRAISFSGRGPLDAARSTPAREPEAPVGARQVRTSGQPGMRGAALPVLGEVPGSTRSSPQAKLLAATPNPHPGAPGVAMPLERRRLDRWPPRVVRPIPEESPPRGTLAPVARTPLRTCAAGMGAADEARTASTRPRAGCPSQKEHDPGERDGRGNEPEIPRQADADDAHHDRQQGDRREGHAISRGDLAEREDDAESHEGKRETLRPRRAKRIQRQAHCDKEEDKEQRLHRPATVEPSRSLMWAPSETRGRVSRRARSPWPLVDRYRIHVLARVPPRITILDCIRANIVPVSRPRPTIARINHQ